MNQLNPLQDDLEHILSHTETLWDSLRDERLFITGGTGFFGCWLLESLFWANQRLNLNVSAVVLSRDPQAFQAKAPHLAEHPAIEILPGDVRGFDFPSGAFSHIIHAATDASPKQVAKSPQVIHETVVLGTQCVLDFAHQKGSVKLLYASSGAVYGQAWGEHRFDENDAETASREHHPHTVYGAAKYEAEQLCLQAVQSSSIAITMARCFALIGPYLTLEGGYALGDFLREGLAGRSFQIEGDGTPRRSYLYASDLMIWLWTILLQGESGRAYNVGSEEAISIRALAEQVAQCFHPIPEIQVAHSPDPKQVAAWYVPQAERAKTELGLGQTVSFAEALQKTIAWHRGGGSRRV